MAKNGRMQLFVNPPTPLTYFAQLVESDDELPLFEAAASLAHISDSKLDIERVRDEVDRLVLKLKQRLSADLDPLQRLKLLNQYFFNELRFEVNRNNFYDPRNSMVHHVLATHRGIPVSLAVIWLELAQSIGLKAMGVGFPGHFLVSVRLVNGLVVIDPATGVSLGRDQLSEHLESIAPLDDGGRSLKLDVDACLKPSTPREVLARMLRNLLEIHASKKQLVAQLAVLHRLVILLPKKSDLRAERGLVYAEMDSTREALEDLEWCLKQDDLNDSFKARAALYVAQIKQQEQ